MNKPAIGKYQFVTPYNTTYTVYSDFPFVGGILPGEISTIHNISFKKDDVVDVGSVAFNDETGTWVASTYLLNNTISIPLSVLKKVDDSTPVFLSFTQAAPGQIKEAFFPVGIKIMLGLAAVLLLFMAFNINFK